MNCGLVRRYSDAYVDGELDPATQLDFEQHLAVCAGCQEEVAFARQMKAHVRDALSNTRAPAHLHDLVRARLDEVDARGATATAPAREPLVRIVPMRLKHAIPLAAAAVVLMTASFVFSSRGAVTEGADARQAATVSSVPIFEDVVRVHTNDLPADVAGGQPQEVTRWFRNKVSFPVRPAEFERRDAKLLGARLSNVRDRRAAALFYDVGGSRVTVVVFDQDRQRHLDQSLRRAHLLGREVRYQQVNGYVVPVREQAGLTYAFTGDLDRHSLLRLAATARVQY
jgi:anti-sigma factor RsiW